MKTLFILLCLCLACFAQSDFMMPAMMGQTPSVKLWMKFNEGVGTTTFDISGNNYTGTLINSPTWVSGISGNALQFASNNTTYVNCGSSAGYPTTNGSIFCWIVLSNNSIGGIVCWGDFATDKSGVSFVNTSSGITVEFATDSTYQYQSTGMLLSTGKWYHVGLMWTGSSFGFYSNTVPVYTYTQTVTPTTGAYNVHIGMGSGTDTRGFTGQIDEVVVANRVLTAGEIAALFYSRQ